MKIITKICLYVAIAWISIISGLVFIKNHVFASSLTISPELTDFIWVIFNLNSESTADNVGVKIKDAYEIDAGSDNIEMQGIKYSPSYGEIYSKSYNLPFYSSTEQNYFTKEQFETLFPAWFTINANEYTYSEIKDNLTEEFDSKALDLINPTISSSLGFSNTTQALQNSHIVTFTLGKQQFLYLTDELGNWLSDTYTDILTSVGQLTFGDKQTLKDDIFEIYGSVEVEDLNTVYTNSLNCSYVYSSTLYSKSSIMLNNNVFLYTDSGDLCFCAPSNIYNSLSGNLTQNIYRNNNLESYFASLRLNSGIYSEVINGITFYRGKLQFYTQNNSAFIPKCQAWSLSYDSLKSWLINNYDFVNNKYDTSPYTVPMVNEDSVPYEVPDVRGLASTIDHVYPSIEATREGILTIPKDTTDIATLIDTLPGILTDTIDDIIADIIADGISIPEILTDTADPENPNPDPENPNPFPDYPPNLPSWFWPTLFPDIFDFKGLNIFKPIFDIVGESYSMYGTWIMIPSIIIFVLIIYIIISVL